MSLSRRQFSREFKLEAIQRMEAGQPLVVLARALEVSPSLLHRWRQEFRSNPSRAFAGPGRRWLAESREAELERKIGQLTIENDFLKKVLRRFEEQARLRGVHGGRSSTRRSRRKPAEERR